MLGGQGTVPQAVHCTFHVKHSVNDISGAEGWNGFRGNIEIII